MNRNLHQYVFQLDPTLLIVSILFCLVIVFSAMFVPGGLTYIAEEKNGRTDHKMDHLACFVGESRFTRIVGRDSG